MPPKHSAPKPATTATPARATASRWITAAQHAELMALMADDATYSSFTVEIQSFKFSGGACNSIYKWNNGGSHGQILQRWMRGGPAGIAVYKINSPVVLALPRLTVSPALPAGTSYTVSVRVLYGSTQLNRVDGITLSGAVTLLPDFTVPSSFASSVVISDSRVFAWEISFDGGTSWQSMGNSGPIPFFWIYDTPTIPTTQTIFDLALQKACQYVGGGTNYPSLINSGIAGDLSYAPDQPEPPGTEDFSGGVLAAYSAGMAQCITNACLLQYLLGTIGSPGGIVTCYWGGLSYTQLKKCGTTPPGLCGSFQANRPARSGLIANPRLKYHAIIDISGTFYDPSYGITTNPSVDFTAVCPGCGTSPWVGHISDLNIALGNASSTCF
jgi:hypothetical protein